MGSNIKIFLYHFRKVSWPKSIDWYERAMGIVKPENEFDGLESEPMPEATDEVPSYKILAKIAEMYHHGGPLLSPDLSKAGMFQPRIIHNVIFNYMYKYVMLI